MLPLYTTTSTDDPLPILPEHHPASVDPIGKRSGRHHGEPRKRGKRILSASRDTPSVVPIHWARRLFPSLFRPLSASRKKMDRTGEEKGLVKALEEALRKDTRPSPHPRPSLSEFNPFISDPVRIPESSPSSTSLSKEEEVEHFALTPLPSCTSLVSFDDVVLEDLGSTSLPNYSPPPSYVAAPTTAAQDEDPQSHRVLQGLQYLSDARRLLDEGPCGPDRAWRAQLAYHILNAYTPSSSSSPPSSSPIDPSMTEEIEADLWGICHAPVPPVSCILPAGPLTRSIRANGAEERMLASERLMMLRGKIICPLKDRTWLPPRPSSSVIGQQPSPLSQSFSRTHTHPKAKVEHLLDQLPNVL
ncbi:hypothetical protein BJ684DRAFT_18357 [Piptocephalis cylindrospora]|uniref:Uncharacterized protein n=1 Tax=Piptocephalis cylindrospora TaxID=1907219 RepID=A0A4P9Y912_9FUNG|nr:hypothetical protein BJ684DRAFT_18357 [Piptocephalis cylindrospora]|eukprot:RKP15314.1 hypothetical protein BJ684DRAFT_18357 [Piptocephalis cylindrospora]